MPYVPKPKVIKKRRVPIQARAIERVNKILDTASMLMGDPDYDKVTTHLIAEKAGVSIGSVYQFFPNVESVKIALIERLLDQYYEHFDQTISANPDVADLVEFSGLLVNTTHEFYQSQPEVVSLIVTNRSSEEFNAVNLRLNEKIQSRVADFFANKDFGLSQAELLRRIGVVIAISDVMTMFIWSSESDPVRAAYLNDWHTMIARYSKVD